MAGVATTGALQAIWTTSIIGISLVILTGWAGQISLGQMALVAVGAFAGGNMTLRMHIPFWVALPLAGLVGALFAVLIGLPALRVRGLFLAVTTFGIAIVLPLFIFDEKFLGRWVPRQDVKPPTLFFLDFKDHRSMYYLSFILFVLVVLAVQALRRSRGGRVLIAMRDNENGVQSFGIDVVRTRLTAFAISGFIAAFAGALLVHQALGMDQFFFSAFFSIIIFSLVVIGGISSIAGAVLGAIFFVGGGLLFPTLLQVIQGIVGLIVLMAIPGGFSQLVFGTRDAVLRVVAMRRHIVVPSLFADYSPEAWEKRLAPLAPAVQSQGLAVLKPEQRYALPSRIFGKATV
jgi:branched-chain amino acid transport system permease protein